MQDQDLLPIEAQSLRFARLAGTLARPLDGVLDRLRAALALAAIASLPACGDDGPDPGAGGSATGGAPSGASAGSTSWFEDVAAPAGVPFKHGFGPTRLWLPEVVGSGLGLFDMDADGDLDLYALQGCDLNPLADPGAESEPFDGRNRLYENRGDGTFEDVTDAAGVGDAGFGMGCAVGDYDGDGRLDLYVTNVGANVLYRNLGNGTFEDVTAAAGVACPQWSASAGFVDYDLDGHMDLMVVNYVIWRSEDEIPCANVRGVPTYCNPNRYQGPEGDRLFRNRGDGTFEDVTESAGLNATFGNGLGLVWGQLDEKPGIDLYVANDGLPNQLWSQTPSGTFEDRAMVLGCALSGNGVAEAGMGVCMEDMDHDGKWDLMVTHLTGETNTFYMAGKRGFRDKTLRSGTMRSSLASTGFGVGMADFDHDGHLDLHVVNGAVILPGEAIDPERPLAQFDQLYRGIGGGQFEEIPKEQIEANAPLTISRGSAYGDIDNDGDVDVCINDLSGHLRILRNVSKKAGGSATLSVVGDDGLHAVGAVVSFPLLGKTVQRQVQRTHSYCASNDPRIHVGLGDAKTIEELEVTWTDGTKERFGPVRAGDFATLKRGEGR